MRLPEVEEWLRERIGVLPLSARVLLRAGGMVSMRGRADKSDCPIKEIETCALAKDVNALFGCESRGLVVSTRETHEDFPNFGGG